MSRAFGFVGLVLALAVIPAAGQDAAAPPDQPAFPANKILARTPNLDGRVEDGEWNTLYTIKTGASIIKVGMSWDSRNLYLLLDGPSIASGVFYLDAMTDGWLNGSDNFEITVAPSATLANVNTKLYNSFVSSPSRALAPIVSGCKAVWQAAEGRAVVEMAFPRNDAAGLALTEGKKLSIGAGVKLTSEPDKLWPADPRASMQTVYLATKTQAGPGGLTLDMLVKDRKVVPGQTLSVDFYANNNGETPIVYQSFTIAGEARVANLLNSLRVRGDTLQPGKRIKHGFSTDLPEDMPLGAFVLRSDLLLADKSTATLLSSFEVLDIIDASLDVGSGPAPAGQERRINVIVHNNRPKSTGGNVTLLLPSELAGSADREKGGFLARTGDSTAKVEFRLKIPASTPPGEYEIRAEVESGQFKETVSGKLLVRK